MQDYYFHLDSLPHFDHVGTFYQFWPQNSTIAFIYKYSQLTLIGIHGSVIKIGKIYFSNQIWKVVLLSFFPHRIKIKYILLYVMADSSIFWFLSSRENLFFNHWKLKVITKPERLIFFRLISVLYFEPITFTTAITYFPQY